MTGGRAAAAAAAERRGGAGGVGGGPPPPAPPPLPPAPLGEAPALLPRPSAWVDDRRARGGSGGVREAGRAVGGAGGACARDRLSVWEPLCSAGLQCCCHASR